MTIFISDLHLGNIHSQAGRFYTWLEKQPKNQKLYLVGDIIDDHRMKIWPYAHKNALSAIFSFTDIILIPGNHDHFFEEVYPFIFWNLKILKETYYPTKHGKYLVVHGDQYDWMMKYALISNRLVGHKIRQWASFIHTIVSGRTANALIDAAREQGCIGVICGHTHDPEISMIDGIHYINCGDWIKNCTAIMEHDGEFELVQA